MRASVVRGRERAGVITMSECTMERSDKLLAMSGVVARMQPRTRNRLARARLRMACCATTALWIEEGHPICRGDRARLDASITVGVVPRR